MSFAVSHGSLFSQLNDLAAGLRNNMAQAVKVATDAAYQDAKGTTLFKDRTGDLRGSIGESVDGLRGKVFRGRKAYFGFVANGTRPHRIEGNPFLSFVWKGVRVSFRYVNHPGTAPRPYMQHAYGVGERTLNAAGNQFADAAIRQFNS